MKTFLLIASFLFTALFVNGQCTPMYDFGDEPFGVMPDTTTGFNSGEVDVLYTQQIDVKIPDNADFLGVPGIVVDSVQIVSIGGMPPGLSLNCTVNTSTECTYLGGSTGCAVISGVPTSGGDYVLDINLNVYATTILGPTEIPYIFDGYSIEISGPVGIEEARAIKSFVIQPNPSNDVATIVANTQKSGLATLAIFDLVGKQISQKQVQMVAGTNKIKVQTSSFPEGVYICKFDAFGDSQTTRLVIVH